MNRLQGKVAFVTGAGRGQGRSHAVHLASEGADIIAIDICKPVSSVDYPMASREDLAETVRLVEALNRRIVSRAADVRDLDGLTGALDEGVAELGGLDIVCANAGIGGCGRAAELSAQTWQDVIDINLTGVFHTMKAAYPHLNNRGGGSVILTSSVAGVKGIQNIAHYSAAKHGLVGLGKTLALEWGERGIRVNTIVPTTVDTPLIHNLPTYRLFAPNIAEPTREDVAGAFASFNALPVSWIDPVDVSRLVLFLASDDARYITGATMPIDAGATA
ncbi:mycofactocin-coupled SDR family oxidoreductase [Rhodococcus opacus]|uniref:3-ketoacyl-ACP reductase n=1 Tax=Rhodococcus opacus TaxID=37919 RepID=A0A076EYM3_RHOOP|nr:mycofactocin-coupled SDR family oxidoreductase [Rhodococcus opacus]AII10886.1 3-ketoacyl-ACP reductase [Rhodococcus opacus]